LTYFLWVKGEGEGKGGEKKSNRGRTKKKGKILLRENNWTSEGPRKN